MAANSVLVQQEGDEDPRSDVAVTELLVAPEQHQDPDEQLEHLWVGTGILVPPAHWCSHSACPHPTPGVLYLCSWCPHPCSWCPHSSPDIPISLLMSLFLILMFPTFVPVSSSCFCCHHSHSWQARS